MKKHETEGPLTIVRGSFLRSTVIYDAVSDRGRRGIDILSCLLGIGIFVAIAWGGWADMITSFRTEACISR